ncbi:MAG TPA: cysteine-rich CWC family protein [Candidatus Paceibacterota bacterium]|nr:cysteine-rich CWC family protein [Candidatus Paceibacterota bacterium]
MNSSTKPIDPTRCPLCGGPNDCQLCRMDTYKGPCWCAKVEVPESLLALLPPDAKNRSCICRGCITAFQRANHGAASTSRPDLNPE